MAILLIIPDDGVRSELHVRLGETAFLRTRTYDQGCVFAEQYAAELGAVVLWAEPRVDGLLVQTVLRLRRIKPGIRIVIITPEYTEYGHAVMDYLAPHRYLLDSDIDAICRAVTSPDQRRRRCSPLGIRLTSKGGSSAAGH